LSSAVAAIAVAAALAGPELLNAPRANLTSTLVLHLPSLAVAALGVYALGALALTTATLVIGTLRVRHRLGLAGAPGAFRERDWIAAFGSTELRRLAPRLAPASIRAASMDGTVLLQSRFSPDAARGELTRLHYISLARSHFFSALIALTAFVGLGLAQDHGTIPFPAGAIPTTAALLIFIGSILLALLGRIAIDVTADPLIVTISQLPAEQVEVGILRRAVEVLEAARASPAMDDRDPAPAFHIPERLALVIEEGHRALLEAIGRLSANADALESRMRWSIESLEAAINTMAASVPAVAGHSDGTAAAAGSSKLQGAVEALTAVLERLTNFPGAAVEVSHPDPRPKAAEPPLARELRGLLREIEPAS